MATLSVTNTFADGNTITAAGFNTNYSDIVNYINNRNSGSSTWDAVSALSSSGVSLTADNSSGTSDIVQFKDNGSTVFSVQDGGRVLSTSIFDGGDGSASAPTFGWASDANTGFYLQSADHARVAAGGTYRMEWNSSQTLFVGGTSAVTPGLALNEASGVGFYRVTGVDVMGVSAPFGVPAGTVSSPGLCFATDLDNGLYLSATNQVSFTAGGVASYFYDANADFKPAASSVATNATTGFFFIVSCAGTPTGAPSGSGRIPIVYDSTNNKLYAFNTATWRGVTLS